MLAAALPCSASAQTQPTGQPSPQGDKATPQWPVTLTDAKGGKVAEPAPEPTWTEAEIAAARAQCAAVLAKVKAVATPLDPIREGECGAPAPVELASIGSGRGVSLSKPAIVTCDMVEVLDAWLRHDVQPAAMRFLGAPVVRIDVMSSYSCRNAYGRKKSRLSEHGRANALDIASFETTDGQQAVLLADWGMTERDIKARIAAAEAAARAHAQAKAAAEAKSKARPQNQKPAPSAVATAPAVPAKPAEPAESEPAPSMGFMTDAMRRAATGSIGGPPTGLGLGQPSQLGGPKGRDAKEPKPAGGNGPAPAHSVLDSVTAKAEARKQFLRELHVSACRRFGTVLGPEANEAHRNHFHLDAAERPRGNYCE
jgi:hypothetical protein